MDTAPPPDVQAQLADLGWVRSLAHALVRDPHTADDLAQDACLVALQHPPRHAENLRGWFGRVLGNLLRQRRRAEHRRRRHEDGLAGSPGTPATPAACALVERAAVQRAVVDAVLALGEPYREAILLRWFEDLPPRAIAVRLGIPVATVHSRLQRGAALLRERLDRRFGSRGAWVAAVLPLAPGTLLPLLGVLVMQGKALAAAAAVLLVSMWWVLRGPSDPGVPEAAVPAGLAAAARAEAPAPGAVAHDASTRTEATPRPAPAAAPSPSEPARPALRGRAIDAEGKPMGGLAVQCGPHAAVAERDGSFVLPAPTGEATVRSGDPEWRTVRFAMVTKDTTIPALLMVAPALDVAGTVTTTDGAPIAGATVRVQWPADLRHRSSDVGDTSMEEAALATADTNGAFVLAAAAVRGTGLVVMADGYLPLRPPLPERSTSGVRFVLERPLAKPGTVAGQVVDRRGAPVAFAHVGLGAGTARCDDAGNFVLEDAGAGDRLVAASAGHRSGAFARPAGGFPPFVVVTLGEPPLSIRGRVVDASGQGVAGAKVWCCDPGVLAASREVHTLEGLAAGATTFGELRQRFERGELENPEQVLRTTATCAWPWVLAGDDGTFVIGGLEDRSYRLRAMDPATLLRADLPDVAAGVSGITIPLPTQAIFERLAGVVVDRTGAVVPGVTVMVQTDTVRIGTSTMHDRAVARTRTDEHGAFRLERVPHTAVYLRLEGDTILPLEFGRDVAGGLLELAGGGAESLRIEVRARLHVQVEVAAADAADEVAMLDGNGAAILLQVFQGRGRQETPTLPLVAGKSVVFVVPDTAHTLLLRKGDAVVRRVVVTLRSGDVNVLRP